MRTHRHRSLNPYTSLNVYYVQVKYNVKVNDFIIQVIDLLNPGTGKKTLDVRWSRKARNFYVDNLFMVDCEELDDLQAVLEEGNKN